MLLGKPEKVLRGKYPRVLLSARVGWLRSIDSQWVTPGSSLLGLASEDPGVLIPPGAMAFILI